jgi:hypothetical protein
MWLAAVAAHRQTSLAVHHALSAGLANKLARIAWAMLARDRQYVTVQALGK